MAAFAPSPTLEHCLNYPKGWFQEAALDFSAKLSANVEFAPPGGRVVHLNSAGEFEMGIGAHDMAIFLFSGEAELDVSNPGTTATGRFLHQAVAPAGNMAGLVATGGYELESSEFDDEQDYAPNDLLTATVDNADIDVGGVLTNAGSGGGGDVEQFVDPVCGVVSRGVFTNEHNVSMLAFWSVFLPGAYA
jgi:hypothetical protein